MRIAAFRTEASTSWGVLDNDGQIRDVGTATGFPALGEALRSGRLDRALQSTSAGPTLELAQVRLAPPVVDPAKILCVGLNYADHIEEMGRDSPQKPVIFTRYPDTLVGSGDELVAPRNSERFDYEGEFAVVIGRGGRHIPADRALDHVLGYTIMNDGSVRDFQRHTHQFTPGKNFPRSGALGPWIVTQDEFGTVETQSISTSVNGIEVQRSDLGQLVFGVSELIAYITEWTELSPGDVIATGTPSGVGDGRDPALYLFPGDIVRVEVEGIGALTNPVTEEA